MEEAKEQICEVVQGHLDPGKYQRYGLVRNGILLYGPRGTGKTFLARATAGEFGLHFEYISAPKLLNRWIGATGENIQEVFAQAAGRKPVLFFIDEIDTIGGGRQDAFSDPGGAGREFNNITMALMSAIDQYRPISGFVLMAATNRLDGLDEALIREGRFDIKVRVDLPNEATRIKILEAQLSKKPWKRFDLQEFARRTPGAGAAKLRALVDQAANYALTDNRKIEARDLQRALDANGGRDRPQLERVEWDDVVIAESVKQDLKSLICLLGDRVEPALEMSKRGGHLWIFLATPLLARECRIYIHDLALRLGVPVKGAGLADGIEVFPKHDAIGVGEFGNAIRGPLGIHRGAHRRFWFYGADYTLAAQIAYLNGLRKVTEEELRRFIAGKERPAAVSSPAPSRNTLPQRRRGPDGSDFRILAHVGGVRKVGRNYITRCPSCADSGHDHVGDNLAILIEDPRFYKCWAGCTKQMIRAALGCPIRVRQSA